METYASLSAFSFDLLYFSMYNYSFIYKLYNFANKGSVFSNNIL